MLRVKIEVGNGYSWHCTHLVEIVNDMTGTGLVTGNYDVVLIETDKPQITARVEAHTRADGALALVTKALLALQKEAAHD